MKFSTALNKLEKLGYKVELELFGKYKAKIGVYYVVFLKVEDQAMMFHLEQPKSNDPIWFDSLAKAIKYAVNN